MNFRKFFKVPMGVMLATTLFVGSGCGGDTTNKDLPAGFTGPPVVTPTTTTNVTFDPSSNTLQLRIPLPNDLVRNPQTGQNALPGTGEPFDSMNSISGFSTAGPIFIPFTANIDATTVSNNTILVINAATRQLQPVTFEVGTGDVGDQSLVIAQPVRPLSPGAPHIVVITAGVRDSNGNAVASSYAETALKSTTPLVDGSGTSVFPFLNDQQANALEPVRAAYQPIWQGAEAATGQPRENIPFAFAFTTQQLFQTLTVIHQRVEAESPTPTMIPQAQFVGPAAVTAFLNSLGPTGQRILASQPQFPNVVGAIRFGVFPATQYIGNVNTANETFFQGPPDNPTPQGTLNLQFMVCQPASPPAGPGPRPTIVFQHGLTRSKEDMLALAFLACSQGFAVIGIDAVGHGSQTQAGLNPLPPPAGQSGTGFIDPANLRLTRDHFRQTVADQMTLAHMIARGATDFNGNGIPDLAPNPPVRPVYIGQSLGGILGGIFLALEEDITTGVLNVAGGRLTNLLLNSPTISAQLLPGLAANGLEPGTISFRQFFWIAQTVVDDADPYNYAPRMLAGSLKGNVPTAILVQEMLNDQVVPNSATTDLTIAMGLNQVNAKQVVSVTPPGLPAITLNQVTASTPFAFPAPIGNTLVFNGSGLFQEQGGSHGYLLDPAQGGPGGQLTLHGQLQAGAFVATQFLVPNTFPVIQRGLAEVPGGIEQIWDFSSLIGK